MIAEVWGLFASSRLIKASVSFDSILLSSEIDLLLVSTYGVQVQAIRWALALYRYINKERFNNPGQEKLVYIP
ncbi:hypothetical protein SynSYN20_02576 [Synechococcus sp. SYN20]|nr:hypothetical protein SynSYN20_02576 [Synechococcus sp. SYN20]